MSHVDRAAEDRPEVRTRWTTTDSGERYERQRWSHRRRRDRDPRLVRGILERRLGLTAGARILDAPCGTARLCAALAQRGQYRYVGVDVSRAMLDTARAGTHSVGAAPAAPAARAARLLRADVARLPFDDDAFELVVCCRLLHHLREPADLARVVAELARVSSAWILGSFWDAGSLEALGKRLPFARRPRHRIARRRAELRAALEASGARVESWHSSLPRLSQQVWFLARAPRAQSTR